MFGSNSNGQADSTSSSSSKFDVSVKEEKRQIIVPLVQARASAAPPPLDTKAAVEKSAADKAPKRKSSKARELIASAKNSLSSSISSANSNSSSISPSEKSFQRILKDDAQIQSPGSTNNSAGETKPGPKTTFRVGVTEDKNRKCRKTMEDTHAYLYNFLPTEANNGAVSDGISDSDNGYFAIFDGHAGTYAADWCGRKLHLILEDTIRKHPNSPIPELLDMTFTNCDGQLEKLPVKNSGCTAVCAVLRWEDRPVRSSSPVQKSNTSNISDENTKPNPPPLPRTERQRILYTANVGDARIVLCRGGKALRLSYDHKGSDENEGRRVANAGGLILNNRVNGVLAVTRALGDSYMKELVTGHPYTTESVIQSELGEFIILACDGLWDVCSDQEAVDLVRSIKDPQEASKKLVDHALKAFSSDNLSCMIVRLDPTGKFEDMSPGQPKGTEDKKQPVAAESGATASAIEAAKKVDDAKVLTPPPKATVAAVPEKKVDDVKVVGPPPKAAAAVLEKKATKG